MIDLNPIDYVKENLSLGLSVNTDLDTSIEFIGVNPENVLNGIKELLPGDGSKITADDLLNNLQDITE